jgi:plastocyanin
MTKRVSSLLRHAGIASALVAAFAIGLWIYGTQVASAANASIGAGDAAGDTVFVPNVVTISAGDSVTFNWVNGVHDARNAATDQIYLPLSTGTASQATTFSTAGTYYFYCSIHAKPADATDANVASGAKMVGKVVVQGATTATATATTPTSTATSTPTTATPTATATATATPTSTPVPPNTVAMPGDYFSPAALTVNSGDTVTFKNQDSDPHTITSVPGSSPGGLNLTLKPGDSQQYSFSTPGLYWYYCTVHAKFDAATGQVAALSTVDNPSEPMEGFILVLATAAAPASANVNIPTGTTNNDSFKPLVTTVQAGEVVAFSNQDTDLHVVQGVPGNTPAEMNLQLPSGSSSQVTLSTPGLYWYYCSVHADWDAKTGQISAHADVDQPTEPMMGVIAVMPAAQISTPTPTPVPTAASQPTVAPRPPSTGSGVHAGDSIMSPFGPGMLAVLVLTFMVALGLFLGWYGYHEQ